MRTVTFTGFGNCFEYHEKKQKQTMIAPGQPTINRETQSSSGGGHLGDPLSPAAVGHTGLEVKLTIHPGGQVAKKIK